MKLLILLTVALCSSAQLVVGNYPWVHSNGYYVTNPLLKSSATHYTTSTNTSPLPTYSYPYFYNHPFAPTATVKQASTDADSSKVITYSAHPYSFPLIHTPLLKTTGQVETKAPAPLVRTSHPLVPLAYHASPYLHNHFPLTYNSLTPFAGLNPAVLPYSYRTINAPVEPVGATELDASSEESSEVEVTRKKRAITIPLPYLAAVPTETKVTYDTTHIEATDDNTPADTTKLQFITKTNEISIPSVKYVQPVVSANPGVYSPLQYTALHTAPINPFVYNPTPYSSIYSPYSSMYSPYSSMYSPYSVGLNPYNFPYFGHPSFVAAQEPNAEIMEE